jgi:hypothetical protein
MKSLLVLIVSLSLTFAGFGQKPEKKDSTKTKRTMTITEVIKKYTDSWMKVPGVVGTGEGESEGKPCVMIFVEKHSDTIEKKIPKTAEGYKVVIEVTGTIEALDR